MQNSMPDISKEDISVVVRYLLEIMKMHEIITEEEYNTVLHRYSEGDVCYGNKEA